MDSGYVDVGGEEDEDEAKMDEAKMGPYWRTLSWSNFKRVFSEILQAEFKLE